MKLIESFLDIASIQAGNMKLRFSDAPIERIVSHAADEMRLKIEGAGLEFIEKYHAPNVYVHLDTERFAQIVTNILGNAVKFTPKGSITIETSIIEDTAQIEIEDTGIGISKTFLPNIYIPFRQGSEGFTRGFQGAGLGLSIAQGLTEAMGGVIELISTEGKGTKVVIKFPIVEPSENIPDEIQKSTPTRSPYAQSGKGRHALVVEDNLENITYIRTVLHRGGWEVRTASSAEDALRLIDEETPDVVLMDINLLGQMNGFDALKIIQGDKRFSHLPIIAVTAYAFETERQLIMDAGFDDYLTKPFTPDQLYDVLAKHVPLLRHV
jgi:CheY-like chemotaxis protein